MPHARANDEDAIVYSEDESVRFVDSDAPPSREITLERLGLADARIAVAINALNERVDSLERLAVASRPVLQLLPREVRPQLSHSGVSVSGVPD